MTAFASSGGGKPKACDSSLAMATISRRASKIVEAIAAFGGIVRRGWRGHRGRRSGLSVFDALRYRLRDHAAVLCAFDLIEFDGKDLRRTRLEDRSGRRPKCFEGRGTVSPTTSTSTATA